jgi:hypothetical protein
VGIFLKYARELLYSTSVLASLVEIKFSVPACWTDPYTLPLFAGSFVFPAGPAALSPASNALNMIRILNMCLVGAWRAHSSGCVFSGFVSIFDYIQFSPPYIYIL